MHVHIQSPDGEVKFWLEPIVTLAENYGLKISELKEIQKVIEEKNNEIVKAWKRHFVSKR